MKKFIAPLALALIVSACSSNNSPQGSATVKTAESSGSHKDPDKNDQPSPKEKEEIKSLVDLGIFKTSKEDSVFRALVGDHYKLFATSTQQTSEEDDLDSLHTKVYASGINGLFTIAENIVMIDSSNNIWSAVIDKEKVYYFTNASRYKDSLPKTIDNWRQRFKEYKIVYRH